MARANLKNINHKPLHIFCHRVSQKSSVHSLGRQSVLLRTGRGKAICRIVSDLVNSEDSPLSNIRVGCMPFDFGNGK